MKNILNYFVMGVAVLGMSAALASCQKESANDKTSTPETPAVRVIHVDLDATVAETKATYAEKVVTIQADDKLYIALTGPESAWTASGTLTFATDKFSGDITINTGSYAGSDPITDAKDLTATFLPKGYSTVGFLSATGVATAANAFYAGTKDASVPQLVHLTATVSNQAGVAKTPLTLVPQNAVLCYTIAANKVIAGAHTVSVSDGTTTISGSVTAVADVATTFAVAFPANATAEDYTMSVVSYEKVVKTGKTLAAGKVVNIPVSALTPLFSVGAGKYVKFSLGNLQYTKSTGTWNFMANQYSTVETTGQNVGENYAVVSLFGWGTSGHLFASGYGASYQPWATSTTSTDYGPTDGSGLTDTYANGDWGINNVIGGYAAGTWRTLTSAEWEWVLGPSSSPNPGTNCRTSSTIGSTENARFVKATVHSTKGLILFPDEITWNATTMGGVPATCNTENDIFTYSPTDANWAALEAAGCVFLPAAGYRNGTSVNDVGANGCYWSSTPLSSSGAFYLYFSSIYVSPASNLNRYYGYSVRLVQDQ